MTVVTMQCRYFLPLLTFFYVLMCDVSLGLASMNRAEEYGLIPHKALYDIQLSSRKNSAQIANIRGKMVYEWQPSCDAWVSSHHFDLTYEYPEAPAMRVTSNFSAHESFDGKDFNFTSQRKRNGMLFEELRGKASVEPSQAEGSAVYTMPEDLVFDLPGGTLFPMAHTIDVLDKIRAGKKFYTATIFDGSDQDGPVEINTFIGRDIPAKKKGWMPENENLDPALLRAKGWNVRLAFFPLSEYSEESDYEMSLIFHENGVISTMDIEYDNFSITQKLVALEILSDVCSEE